MQHSTPLGLSAMLILAPAALAQGQVHVVDDDGGPGVNFTDLPPAVAAAAPGDTLLVKGGSYSGFVVDGMGLVVLADSGQVIVDGEVTVRNVPTGETVLVRGIQTGIASGNGLSLEWSAGHLRIEDSTFTGQQGFNSVTPGQEHPQGFAGASVVGCADVSFSRCVLLAGDGAIFYDWDDTAGRGGTGIFVSSSNVAFHDSDATGGEGGSDWGGLAAMGGWGGSGGELFSGVVFAIGSDLLGGRGGSGGTDWTWGGCANGSPGGTGMHVDSGVVNSRATTTVGGPGGFGAAYYGCSNGFPGQDISGGGVLVPFPGGAKGYVAPAPLRVLTTQQLTFTGTAGDLVFAGLSVSGAGFTPLPFASGALLLDASPVIFVAGVLPGSGSLALPVQLPGVPGGQPSLLVHGQSLHVESSGQVLLGAYSAMVILAVGF